MFPNASLGIHPKGTNVVKSTFVPFNRGLLFIQVFIQMLQKVDAVAIIPGGNVL